MGSLFLLTPPCQTRLVPRSRLQSLRQAAPWPPHFLHPVPLEAAEVAVAEAEYRQSHQVPRARFVTYPTPRITR